MTDGIDIAAFNKSIIEEFRANDGKVGGMFAGNTLALITTKGAKSGETRVNPLACLRDGDNVVIIASNGGADKNPAWYHNVIANPDVTVEVGTEKFEATAQEVKGEERDALYARMAERAPGFAEYQEKTSRIIPVILLKRKNG